MGGMVGANGELRRIVGAIRAVNTLIWIVAIGLLTVSTVSASTTLAAHQFPGLSAVLLPLCVDLGVGIALIAGQVLANHGMKAGWGTVLRWVAAVVGLALNEIGPVLDHDGVGCLLHALPTLLLLVVVEAGASYLFLFGRLRLQLEHQARQTTAGAAGGGPIGPAQGGGAEPQSSIPAPPFGPSRPRAESAETEQSGESEPSLQARADCADQTPPKAARSEPSGLEQPAVALSRRVHIRSHLATHTTSCGGRAGSNESAPAVDGQLWNTALQIRAEIAADGARLNRAELRARLRDRGLTLANDKAGLLLAALKTAHAA